MNLRTFLPIVLVFIATAVVAGCAKEQPTTKGVPKESAQPSTPESGSVRAGEVCDTIVSETATRSQAPTPAGATEAGLPRLVDLGRGTCIPCKQMAPILEELSREYEGRAIVEVIDLRYRPQAAMEYGIKLIPTQVFFDKKGVEVWRHEGFMPKDQIVAKFQELGVKAK
ncbi:MAG: thioredoxin family protein [Candidatus Eisenbacteria bacterium]